VIACIKENDASDMAMSLLAPRGTRDKSRSQAGLKEEEDGFDGDECWSHICPCVSLCNKTATSSAALYAYE
jgi:hypothetical protein